jgi:hypothetical protein
VHEDSLKRTCGDRQTDKRMYAQADGRTWKRTDGQTDADRKRGCSWPALIMVK